ncbi:MAG TPA: hypothetical protein VKA83_09205 [Methylomirabilota bacterium]|nr:hypothetical protein [Methylomirabilota bacterium]
MSDDNGEHQPEAPKPKVPRVILSFTGTDLYANFQIASEHCSPALVEAILLRGLAIAQREMLLLRFKEDAAAAMQAQQTARDAEAVRRQIEGRGR